MWIRWNKRSTFTPFPGRISHLSGSFFPTAYIKDFDSGYLRGELLLIHSAEGDYARWR